MPAGFSKAFVSFNTVPDLNGKQLPIYLRVTIGGERFVWSTQRYAEQQKWSGASGKVKGTTEEAKTINAYLV